MKKFLLLLILTFSSFFLFSQEKVSLLTYKNKLGEWNENLQKFIFSEEYNYQYINFTLRDTYIEANDYAKSLYRIVKDYPKEIKDSTELIKLDCLDENNKKCVLSFLMNKVINESYIIINYGNICYFYVIIKK